MDWWGDLLLLGVLFVSIRIDGSVRQIASATQKAADDRERAARDIAARLDQIEERLR